MFITKNPQKLRVNNILFYIATVRLYIQGSSQLVDIKHIQLSVNKQFLDETESISIIFVLSVNLMFKVNATFCMHI